MYQSTKSHSQERKPNQVIGSVQVLMPEAVCCCLQTCKCGFDIRVVLCASVPSLIVRNASYRQKCKFTRFNA